MSRTEDQDRHIPDPEALMDLLVDTLAPQAYPERYGDPVRTSYVPKPPRPPAPGKRGFFANEPYLESFGAKANQKTLVDERYIKSVIQIGARIVEVPPGSLFTPLARDMIAEHDLEIRYKAPEPVQEELREEIVVTED